MYCHTYCCSLHRISKRTASRARSVHATAFSTLTGCWTVGTQSRRRSWPVYNVNKCHTNTYNKAFKAVMHISTYRTLYINRIQDPLQASSRSGFSGNRKNYIDTQKVKENPFLEKATYLAISMTADKFNAFFNSWIRIRIFHDADSRPNSLPQCGSGSAQLVNLSIKVDTCRNIFFGLIKEDNNFKLNNIFTKKR